MAILDSLPDLEITIQSFHHDLPEYPDDGDYTCTKYKHMEEAKRTSTYVECKANAEFCIKFAMKRSSQIDHSIIAFTVDVDGHRINKCLLKANASTAVPDIPDTYIKIISSRVDILSNTEHMERSLRFSRIKKVDNHDSTQVENDCKLVDGIGEIVVVAFRAEETKPLARMAHNSYSSEITRSKYQLPTEVSEKAFKGKAISHGVSYGPPKIGSNCKNTTCRITDLKNPIGFFVFKYRTRDDLKSELIILRSPSPQSPVHQPDSRHRNSSARASELNSRLADLKKEIAEIKTEEENLAQSRKRRYDAQESNRTHKMSRGQNDRIVIDLTDD